MWQSTVIQLNTGWCLQCAVVVVCAVSAIHVVYRHMNSTEGVPQMSSFMHFHLGQTHMHAVCCSVLLAISACVLMNKFSNWMQ